MRPLRIAALLLFFGLPPLAATPPTVPLPACALRLSIEAKALRIPADDWLEVTATLENVGSTEVVLVEPGDGSESGWRTPVLRWSARRIERGARAVTLQPEPRCGLMNGPQPRSEVFALAPGSSRRLEMPVFPPRLGPPGLYEVTLTYENDPAMAFHGTASDDPALRPYKKSTACRITSAPLRVEITVAGTAETSSVEDRLGS